MEVACFVLIIVFGFRSILFFHLAMVARPAQSLVAIMLSNLSKERRNDSL